MASDVKKWVTRCDLCQRVKHLSLSMEGEFNMVSSERPDDLITVDIYGPFPMSRGGAQYIFVMLDAFSEHVSLYTMKNV